MNLKFEIDNFHYFDKKLLEENTLSVSITDWKNILQERKKQFSNHAFIVIQKDKCLFIETILLSLFKITYKNDCIHIDLDSSLKESELQVYLIQLHEKEQCLKISSDGEFPIHLYHENIISQKGHSYTEINAFNNLNYYHTNHSLTEQVSHQEFLFNITNHSNLQFAQKSEQSKTKIDVKINLYKKSSVNFDSLINLGKGQIRDDSIEVTHLDVEGKSFINYISINGGKSVSQINSIIEEKAFNSETKQSIKHILLHENAQSFSKPNLMIKNPDVIAAHGNSIGSFQPEALFYLQQHGISQNMAKSLITRSMIENFCDNTKYSKQLLSYFLGDNNDKK